MRKIILFILAILLFPNSNGFSQSVTPQFTKARAISILRDNYLFMYFKNPDNTNENIDKFLNDINKIVPLHSIKRSNLKSFLISAIQNSTEKIPIENQMYSLPMKIDDFIPLLGVNVYQTILKDNYLFMYFKNPDNTDENIDKFLNDIYPAYRLSGYSFGKLSAAG